MEECVICQTPIDNKTYAFINNDHERGVYHINCLTEWLERTNTGILSEDKITSYLVFDNGTVREVTIADDTPGEPDVRIPLIVIPPLSPDYPALIQQPRVRRCCCIDENTCCCTLMTLVCVTPIQNYQNNKCNTT
jgi:hypothetical protein